MLAENLVKCTFTGAIYYHVIIDLTNRVASFDDATPTGLRITGTGKVVWNDYDALVWLPAWYEYSIATGDVRYYHFIQLKPREVAKNAKPILFPRVQVCGR